VLTHPGSLRQNPEGHKTVVVVIVFNLLLAPSIICGDLVSLCELFSFAAVVMCAYTRVHDDKSYSFTKVHDIAARRNSVLK